jgi:phage terminase small subunit
MTKGNKPTEMQAKAMQYILDGEKPKDAMIRAGYSPKVAKDYKQNLLEYKGPQQIIKEHQAEFARVGITPIYMARKTAEWLEATKIKSSMTEPDKEVPDYQIQIKAAERVDKIWGINQENDITNVQINITPILGKDTKTE